MQVTKKVVKKIKKKIELPFGQLAETQLFKENYLILQSDLLPMHQVFEVG